VSVRARSLKVRGYLFGRLSFDCFNTKGLGYLNK